MLKFMLGPLPLTDKLTTISENLTKNIAPGTVITPEIRASAIIDELNTPGYMSKLSAEVRKIMDDDEFRLDKHETIQRIMGENKKEMMETLIEINKKLASMDTLKDFFDNLEWMEANTLKIQIGTDITVWDFDVGV